MPCRFWDFFREGEICIFDMGFWMVILMGFNGCLMGVDGL